MSAAAPWSVKGIDPKARGIAKDLARRSGMTLGDWLNRMIMEDSSDEEPSAAADEPPIAAEEFGRLCEALEGLSARITSAEHRSTLAISGIDQTVLGLLSRLQTSEREQVAVAARFEGALDEIKTDHARAAERLARTEELVAQPHSAEALRSLEAALGQVAAHLYQSETQTRDGVAAMRAELGGLTQRVDRLDQTEAAPSQEMIDGVVLRIVQRLEEAEARTSGAIRGLEASISDFDHRLRAAEARGEGPEQRLEELAAGLIRNFDAAREELVGKLQGANDARFEAMERSLKDAAGQVRASEHRTTQAMERVGHEVLRVAEVLGRRMEGVEARSAEAMGQVGGEISRIADAFEGRLRKADQAQAESLERLGVEIARITERLADRIANSERRSAQAVDDVGEQVSRITERLNQRHERASTDLAERIRQSEERTARLLEEAREKIDRRLAGTERRLSQKAAFPPERQADHSEPLVSSAEPDLAPEPFERSAFGATAYAHRGANPIGYVPLAESLPPAAERSPFEGDDFDAAEMFEAFEAEAEAAAGEIGASAEAPAEASRAGYYESAAVAAQLETEAESSAQAVAEPMARPSTRDLIAQAHAAAQAAAQPTEAGRSKLGLFSGFGVGKSKPKWTPSRLKTGVMMAAAAAVLGIATAGATVFNAQRVSGPRSRPSSGAGAAIPARRPTQLSGAQAAVALAPQVIAQARASAGADAAGLYTDAIRRIEGDDNSGVAGLRRAADLGYAPAQFYLAKLYEGGQSGLAKDVVAARLWTQRAAENGDRKAMHNLALYYFEGTGGPKDPAAAAQWFRRAADLGLVDSQYNLARLYQGGFGVPKSPADAYEWYLIAARSGDGESRSAADSLQVQLPADARVSAQRAAQAFRAAAPSPIAQVAAAQSTPAKAAG